MKILLWVKSSWDSREVSLCGKWNWSSPGTRSSGHEEMLERSAGNSVSKYVSCSFPSWTSILLLLALCVVAQINREKQKQNKTRVEQPSSQTFPGLWSQLTSLVPPNGDWNGVQGYPLSPGLADFKFMLGSFLTKALWCLRWYVHRMKAESLQLAFCFWTWRSTEWTLNEYRLCGCPTWLLKTS